MADIARIAQVSSSTVSRALAGSSRISGETRARISAIAQEHGYRLNRAARSLRSSVSGLIGLVVPNIRNPFYAEVALELERHLSTRESALIVVNTSISVDVEVNKIERLLSYGVDGVIISPVSDYSSHAIELLKRASVPCVQIDRRVPDVEASSVLLDNKAAGMMAVGHAAELGAKRVGIITGHPDVTTGRERLNGALEEAQRLALRIDPEFVQSGEFTKEAGYWLCKQLFQKGPVDTVIAMSNLLSLGAFQAMNEENRRCQLIAFDHSDWYELVSPQIPYVSQPIDEIAAIATRALLKNSTRHYRVQPRMRK